MPLDVEKPLSIEEAIVEFKNSGLYFMVFKDLNGEKRVILINRKKRWSIRFVLKFLIKFQLKKEHK